MQGVLQHLGVGKTCITPLQLQSDGMVKRYMKTAEEYVTRAIASYPLAYDTICLTADKLVFGRELHLPCGLIFGFPPSRSDRPLNDAADLVYGVHDVHNYERQNLDLTSDRMKVRYDRQQTPRASN